MNKQTIFYTVLAVTLIGSVFYATQDNQEEFSAWKAKYGMKFNQAEDVYRSMIFHRNLDIIKSHNHNKDRTYDMGVNKFTGLTDEQFASTYLTPKKYDPEWENVNVETQSNGVEVDWTTKGVVSRVKNQGSCGSCWAFSAVGVLESWALQSGRTVDLSEQQLVDCSGKYGNAGCNGGYNYQGLAYVKDHGITDQNSYPYVAKTQHCNKDGGDFKINSVQSTRGCDGLVNAISARPVGVSADATKWSKYASGVFNDCATHLNHDILLVGVSDSYWKIKNSWGPDWGERGFIRLARGNTCGVCQDKSPWVQ